MEKYTKYNIKMLTLYSLSIICLIGLTLVGAALAKGTIQTSAYAEGWEVGYANAQERQQADFDRMQAEEYQRVYDYMWEEHEDILNEYYGI